MKKLTISILLAILLIGTAGAERQTFDGKCPICKAMQYRSKVYGGGYAHCTLIATRSWYDEDGNYHFEDPNT